MIPAPFMDRNATIRQLEGLMIMAALQWANDPEVRAVWERESVENFLHDIAAAVRRSSGGISPQA